MNENIYVVIVSGSTTIFYCAKFILFNVFALKRDKCCYPESFDGIWVHVVLKHGPCRAKHDT